MPWNRGETKAIHIWDASVMLLNDEAPVTTLGEAAEDQ